MRRRDSIHRDGELARVVDWLDRRARLMHEAAAGVAGLRDVGPDVLAPVADKMRAEGDALRQAARLLEAGVHRA